MKNSRKTVFIFLTAFLAAAAFCQPKQISYNGSGSYIYVERTDLRRYDNKKYMGLVSREIRSYITPESNDGQDRLYDGSFYVFEEMKRASRDVKGEINEAVESVFSISSDGRLKMIKDNGYPTFRSFPAYTSNKISIGDKWQSKGERTVDPLNKGIFTKMPILVEYTYVRDDVFHGEEVFVLNASWATVYGISYTDRSGDASLKKAMGSHKATICVSKKTGNALVVRDTVDETFIYDDGNEYRFAGSISLFTEYPPTFDRYKLYPSLQKLTGASKSEIASVLEKQKQDDSEKARIEAEKKRIEQEKIRAEEERLKAEQKRLEAERAKAEAERKRAYEEEMARIEKQRLEEEKARLEKQRLEDERIKSEKKRLALEKKRLEEEKAILEKQRLEDEQRKIALEKQRAEEEKKRIEEEKRIALERQRLEEERKKAEEKESLRKSIETKDKIKVESTDQGIMLTIQDLRFKPDSAELLDGETGRLDSIAAVLREAEGRMFLVEGHTAKVGYEAGEQKLSLERAKSIAKALSDRGIDSGRFIVKGAGSSKPVASNATSDGKAQNRRVEITILE